MLIPERHIMLPYLLCMSMVVVAVLGGKVPPSGRDRHPECQAPKFCYWWIGKHKEVYGPVPLCYPERDYAYSRAKQLCREIDLRLCSSMDLWRGIEHPLAPQFEPFPGRVMAPVYDEYNEWMQTGDAGCNTCPDMGKTFIQDLYPESNGPYQGTSNVAKSYKSPVIYCCPKIRYRAFYLGHHVTWQQASDFCDAQVVNRKHPHYDVAHPEKDEKDYYRLCDSVALCKQRSIPRHFRGIDDQDTWVPVADSTNEWVNMNEDDENLCKRYSWIDEFGNKPSWGEDDSCELEERGIVYCCRDVRRVYSYHHHGVHSDEGTEDDKATAGDGGNESNDESEDFANDEPSDGEIDAAREIGAVKIESSGTARTFIKRDPVEAQAIISL